VKKENNTHKKQRPASYSAQREQIPKDKTTEMYCHMLKNIRICENNTRAGV